MVQAISKFAPVRVSCITYVHPWTDSCSQAACGLFLYAIGDSLKIYTTVYVLRLIMKGKLPSTTDLQRTVTSIFQSTAFLSMTATGFSMFLCLLRRMLGGINILTAAALPVFLSSLFAIQLERPSRRPLLALYVSNVATETIWKMLLSRQLVKPVKYGQVALFAASTAVLLAIAKSGKHKVDGKTDAMFNILRFVVGPYEDRDCGIGSNHASSFHRQQDHSSSNEALTSKGASGSRWQPRRKNTNAVYNLVIQAFRLYKRFINKIKCCERHHTCSHPFSCLYYTLQGSVKMFSTGVGLQVILKLILNIKGLVKSPKSVKDIVFRRDNLNIATFLCGANGLFRATMCMLRRFTGKDNAYHALLGGLIAGLAFIKYPDTKISLYVFWKTLHIIYNLGIQEGYVPNVPGFTVLLHCFSTAVLFHAAIVEPLSLRSSYWKFLHSISGGRVSSMNRAVIDCWGLETSKALNEVMLKTKTKPIVAWYWVQ